MKRFITAAYCGTAFGWMLTLPLIRGLYGDEVLLASMAVLALTGGVLVGMWWKDS